MEVKTHFVWGESDINTVRTNINSYLFLFYLIVKLTWLSVSLERLKAGPYSNREMMNGSG